MVEIYKCRNGFIIRYATILFDFTANIKLVVYWDYIKANHFVLYKRLQKQILKIKYLTILVIELIFHGYGCSKRNSDQYKYMDKN